MTVNNRTSSRNYAKPNVANLLSEDVLRLSEALDSIDTDVAALQSKAPLASPALTGTPLAPTPAVDTNTTQVATTAFVVGQASAANPAINGAAAAGSSSRYARADHVHPTDTSLAPVASPTFTGTPAAPTPAAETNTTQLATTAFVAQSYAKQTRTVFAGAGLTGGGDLSVNRTIAADVATQAEAEAGTSNAKLMTPQRVAQALQFRNRDLTLGTAVASASGSSICFTDIPSWAKRVTIMFDKLRTSESKGFIIQLGDSDGVETTGYQSGFQSTAGVGSFSTLSTQGSVIISQMYSANGFGMGQISKNIDIAGSMTFSLLGQSISTWMAQGTLTFSTTTAYVAGSKTLSGTLDRVCITTISTTPLNLFVSGSLNIMYEG